MGAKVFVPLTDEVLYEHPELIAGPLRPYRPEWRELRRLRPEESRGQAPVRGPRADREPGRAPEPAPAALRLPAPVVPGSRSRAPGAGH